MANLRDLRRRIKSVKNTAQITKAMQMVAATKMKRAQNQALGGRPYSFNLSSALKKVLPLVELGSHPLLQANDSKKSAVIITSTDKGLCGSLNTNLFRMLSQSDLLSSENNFITVGKKGRNFIARMEKNLVADFENLDTITFRQATLLSKLIVDSFLKAEIGQAFIAYPHFGSALRQEPIKMKLLPIDLESVILSVTKDIYSSSSTQNDKDVVQNDSGEFLFEPDPKALLDYILIHHIQIKIYQALMETKASEYSAKMIAMQNATDNALELVDDLNLSYNQTRQANITKELLEITTAQAAME